MGVPGRPGIPTLPLLMLWTGVICAPPSVNCCDVLFVQEVRWFTSRVADVEAVADAEPGDAGFEETLWTADTGKYQTPPWLPSGEGRPTMPCFGTSTTRKNLPSMLSVCSFHAKPTVLKASRTSLLSLLSLTKSPTLQPSSAWETEPRGRSWLIELRPSSWMELRASSCDAMFIRPSPMPLALPASSSMHSSCSSIALLAAPSLACRDSFSSRKRSSSRFRASISSSHLLWMFSRSPRRLSRRSARSKRSSSARRCSSDSSYCALISLSSIASVAASASVVSTPVSPSVTIRPDSEASRNASRALAALWPGPDCRSRSMPREVRISCTHSSFSSLARSCTASSCFCSSRSSVWLCFCSARCSFSCSFSSVCIVFFLTSVS
mmetsp:Transcript_110105/g.344524  ORF Transcript_110105/g.344524 Transcript_110105/m.344524 type:complete len:380 (-) Transcript_110105:260-1399(-)